MIKIEISKDKITITGHANYNDYGKDIVCAAVSSTVITTVNGILSINSDALKVTEGKTLIIEILKHDEVTDKLINNMINLLEELKNDYKDNINIRRC
ncbi:MAG TPA: ribosomal-processing cysteine protease Prp [Bacilli bacterium]|nr:ribosomal-processing cysteine protease Prp [Bacilli bacterium]